MVFVDHGDISTAHAHGGWKRCRYAVCTNGGMVLIGFQQDRLMPMFLCSESSNDIFGKRHELPTLVVETQDGLFGFFRWPRRSGNVGLLFHSWLGGQGSCHIMQIPDFIPLVLGESHRKEHTVPAGG